jgi:polar amino acid transport system substrate-binding protein
MLFRCMTTHAARLLLMYIGAFALLAPAGAACTRAYTTYVATQLGYTAFYRDGQLAGAAVDFYAELEKRTGCVIRVAVVPPARLAALSHSGRLPLLAMAANMRADDHRFVPLIAMSMDLLIRRDVGIDSLEKARQAPAITFGSVEGLTYGDWGDRFFEQLPASRVDHSPDIDALYRKLIANRIQATFGFSLNYLRNLDLEGLREQIRIVPVTDSPRGVIGVKFFPLQMAPRDLALLERASADMRDDGTLEKLLTHWVDHAMAKDMIWRASRDGPP